MEKTKTHIAVVSSPWFSNLASSFEFSKRFANLHPNFQLSFFIPILESLPDAFKSILETETLPTNLNPILLPPISKDDMPPNAEPVLQKKLTLIKSLPHIHHILINSLTSNSTHLSALVADPFALEVLDFAKQLKTLTFIYFASSAMALSVFFHLPKLHDMISCEFRDFPKTIRIPGCVQIRGIDLPEPVQDRSSPTDEEFLEMTQRFHSVDGFLVNSFLEMEESTVKAFANEGKGNFPLLYLVGPVAETKYEEKGSSDSKWLRWLEKQPPKSVLYICFGGGGTLSQHQTNELALGLELSGNKFLWVMRAPSNSVNVGLEHADDEDPLKFLPEGFLERTKEQGLVVPLWAPQIPILHHSSIGGFLSHCGWNSVIESVQYGVPIIAWPLFAEQRLNAALVSNGLKVALWPKVNENEIVEREEISKVIKSLMEDEEGKEIYRRMECLKEAAANAVKDDGSSTKAMHEVAMLWKNFRGI
ncbi:hydroquinone glucosyltransferase-like [Senna tora]|uniref:Glycosyltransferase n=1 Tax=Senna tora TaxID=362788 RepID=A0A834TEX5_9FABA|nr:hydroquinone glucosyltransferase-like [Senna tora]